MSEATRRLNQLDFGLERVQDPIVREALVSVVEYVQSLASSGVYTKGIVQAQDFRMSEGVKSAQGELFAQDLNLADGGKFRTKVIENVLDNGDDEIIILGGSRILGVIGWTESTDTSSVSGNTVWYPIRLVTATDRIFLEDDASSQNEEDRVNLRNESGSDLEYRLIIFYRENEV